MSLDDQKRGGEMRWSSRKEDIPESDEGSGGQGGGSKNWIAFTKPWPFVRHCPKSFRCANSFDPIQHGEPLEVKAAGGHVSLTHTRVAQDRKEPGKP